MMNTKPVTHTDQSRWDAVNERYSCDHEGLMRLTIFTDSIHREHYRYQCSRCGHEVAVKKVECNPREVAEAHPTDPTIKAEWDRVRSEYARELFDAERVERRAEFLDDFRAEHDEFMQSPEWAEMRRKVMKRAGGLCEGCLSRPAVQVHHLNYDRQFGREMLFDLRAVCVQCHEAIHDPDNKRVV